MKRVIQSENVLEMARKRVSLIFDSFECITVSVSSGKDSTVCYHLFLQEAILRDRKIHVLFLDQEAEYAASIKLIKIMMEHKNVIPLWYQVPLYLTNATSYTDYFLHAWGEGERWIREKDPFSIHEIKGEYPKRFYDFFKWYEDNNPESVYIIGLRAEEGITRYRTVTSNPGWNGIRWSTVDRSVIKFYPIYDWSVSDVWKFIYDFNIPYNKIYDLMFLNNYSIYSKMRVSNLIHEKSFKCLADLPKFEPETYDRLCRRLRGVETASRYSLERMIFNNKVLPRHYSSWLDFRNFLMENIPDDFQREMFRNRFLKQEENERIYQAQVGQLLINDYENSRPFNTKKEKYIQKEREKWMEMI